MMGMEALQTALGGVLPPETLLREALTHPSAGAPHYQRLEFLGDRVLGVAVAQMLFRRFPHANEGELTRRHTALVRTEMLAKVANSMGLEALIVRGPGETAPVGPGVLADIFEALLGAVLEGCGADAAFSAIAHVLGPFVDVEDGRDAKTQLQEALQAGGHPLPVYTVLREDGPPHAPTFVVQVACALGKGTGTAGSKQAAGQMAAMGILLKLKEDALND